MKNDSGEITGAGVLQFLRISLHVLFASLLLVGAFSAVLEHSDRPVHRVLVIVLTALLGGLYMAGTVFENRRTKAWSTRSVRLRWLTATWLAVVTGLWIALMVLSHSFTWSVFPLLFLYLYLLPMLGGLISVVFLTGFAVVYPAYTSTRSPSPGAVIGPILGAGIAVIIFFAYKGLYNDAVRHAHIARQLRATRAELAQTQHEAGRLEERERLAREIHDTLAQGLSSIVLMSRAGQATLQNQDVSATGEALTTIEKSASDNLAEARRFIKDLSSPTLDMNLADSLSKLAIDVNQQSDAQGTALRCEFSFEGDPAQVSEETAQQVLRIAQGAVSNVVAHAQASQAVITLSIWDAELTLDVFDNGIGFDPARAKPTSDDRGFGLTSLRERAELLGGHLTVSPAQPHGTILTVNAPLEKP